jgi:hypothetical protein
MHLLPGEIDTAVSPDTWVALPGTYFIRVTAPLAGDMHPENNTLIDTFWVRGSPQHDVGVSRMFRSPPIPQVGDTVRFTAEVVNYGGGPETLWAFMSVLDSAHHLLFLDSVHLVWPDSMGVAWWYVFTEPAIYWAVCSLYLAPDQNRLNDVRRTWFLVDPRPGIEESRQLTASSSQPAATVVRGVLLLAEATSLKPQAASLLDITGRKVLALKPGANDVSQLPSGVYFVRAVSRKLSAASCQKVVIQR